jgi:hypothetical protein
MEWTHIAIGVAFDIPQSCGPVAAAFTKLAFWPENVEIVCYFIIAMVQMAYFDTIQSDNTHLGSSSFCVQVLP